MFAKSEKTKKLYQDNWNTIVKYRGYVAVVEGELKKQEDIITQYLTENDNYYIYPTNSKKGKKAITCYRVLKTNKKYSLLNIEIKTGRKNQIRVAMKTIGHPIVGDYKYGSKDNSIKRLGLCANKLIVNDPINKKEFVFEIQIPNNITKIVK